MPCLDDDLFAFSEGEAMLIDARLWLKREQSVIFLLTLRSAEATETYYATGGWY